MKYKNNSLLGMCVFGKLNALELLPTGKLIYRVITGVTQKESSLSNQ